MLQAFHPSDRGSNHGRHTVLKYGLALLCVAALSAGQILFKLSANYAATPSRALSLSAIVPLAGALFIYAMTTAVWLWILQRAELGRIYPIMALAFVFVPLGSHLVFGERFNLQYFIGIALIIGGIALSVWR